SVLKVSVLVGFLLLVLVAESHAGCLHERLKAGATRCQDIVDKTWHPIGSSWKNSKCNRCWCMDDLMRCCDG
ncbi:beta-microseminoprotein-like, partial [Clarias magur]